MFEKTIIIPQSTKNSAIDFGKVAESLIFYEEVNLFLKEQNLNDLLRIIPIDYLIELIQNHGLKLHFTQDHLLIHQRDYKSKKQIGIGFHKSQECSQELIEKGLSLKNSNLPRHTEFLLNNIKPYYQESNIANQILDTFLDKDYIDYGLRKIINNNEILPLLDLQFQRNSEGKYLYSGNLLDSCYFDNGTESEGGIETSFNAFVAAQEQLSMAMNFNCGISTNYLLWDLINYRTNDIVQNSLDKRNFKAFTEVIIPTYTCISEKINEELNVLPDFIKILEKSKPFKSMLKDVGNDTNILNEYYVRTSENSWIDKLPAKGTRFAIFTGAGLILDATLTGGLGTVISTSLSAGDNFFLDKVLNHWRPSFQLEMGIQKINAFAKK